MITSPNPSRDEGADLARMVREPEPNPMSQDEEIVLLRRQVADLTDRVARLERPSASEGEFCGTCGLHFNQRCGVTPCQHQKRRGIVMQPYVPAAIPSLRYYD